MVLEKLSLMEGPVMRTKVIFQLSLIIISIFCLGVLSVSPAFAQVTFTQNKVAFLGANKDLAFQDFLSTFVAPGDLRVCDSPVNYQSDDDCFSPGDILPGIEFTIVPPKPGFAELILVGSDFLGNSNPTNPLIANQFQSGLDISFTDGVKAVGFTAGCLLEDDPCTPRNVVVTVIGDGGQLGSTVVEVSDAFDTFLGVSSDEPIREIIIKEPTIGPGLSFQEGVLNVWFGVPSRPIPALSEWGMVAAAAGLMLAGLLFALRKRRAAV